MAKAKPKKPPVEDEAQSRRFIETARALEDAGELSPTAGQRSFEALLDKAAPPKRPQK